MQFFELSQVAEETIMYAATEATSLRHYEQEPVHLLLALTMRNNHRAYGVLRSMGVTLESARPLVQAFPIASYEVGRREVEKYSHTFTEIINYAIELAQQKGRVANPGHLLIALVKYDDLNVANLLSKLGVHPGELVRKMAEVIESEQD